MGTISTPKNKGTQPRMPTRSLKPPVSPQKAHAVAKQIALRILSGTTKPQAKAKRKKKNGRPRKLKGSVDAQVMACLAMGASIKDATDYVGLDYSTILKRRDSDPSFSKRMRHAVALGKRRLVFKIMAASDWKAAAWMLERKWWKEYAKRTPDLEQLAALAQRAVHPLDALRDLLHQTPAPTGPTQTVAAPVGVAKPDPNDPITQPQRNSPSSLNALAALITVPQP